jgi:beta-glucosidase/6-phospho-beta-glucosidase/beta-galactosidase
MLFVKVLILLSFKTSNYFNLTQISFFVYYYLCRYASPVTYGEYPETMRDLVGNRLPRFTTSQSEMLKGSYDFIGVNYYTARYAEDSSSFSSINLSYTTDSRVNLTS